jgi:SAM-dependent methyltransferase
MHQLNEVTTCYNLTAAEYANTYYHELEHKPFDRLALRRFAEENRNKGKIADLGCGCGHTTKFLHDLGNENLLGIDLSPEMVKIAQKLNPNINFETGNMLNLARANEEFGAVLAFYAIVHLDYAEIEQAFAEIFRVLKPSGQFLFSFHVGNEKNTVDEFLHQKVNVTFYFLDVDKILQISKEQGFKTIDAAVRYPYEGYEYPSKRAYILLEK